MFRIYGHDLPHLLGQIAPAQACLLWFLPTFFKRLQAVFRQLRSRKAEPIRDFERMQTFAPEVEEFDMSFLEALSGRTFRHLGPPFS